MSRTLGPAARSFAIAFAVIFALLGFGCGSDDGTRRENQLPSAQLTAGPVEGDTTSYQVRLFWTGEDPDGYVSAYEIAVDPPEEIESNADAAGVAWERTTDFSRLFRFSTLQPELTGSDPPVRPTGRFHGMHAVYVRAVDDEGAVSAPAHIAVTARSIAPVTTIVGPNIQPTLLTMGSALRVSWRGEDTDPTGAGPLAYEYKLIYLNKLVPPISIIRVEDLYGILAKPGTGSWVPVDDSISVRLPLDVPAQCVLAMRATNAAGATEPFFDWGRNAFKFQTFASTGWPSISLTSELGTFVQRWSGRSTYPSSADMFMNAPIHFVVNASAEEYGEEIIGWRWGVDLADIESEEGWSPWTTDPNLPPISFAQEGTHNFYVEARDGAGRDNWLKLTLHVYSAPLDRPVLWVDDSRDKTFPSDAQHDAFWLSLFQDSGRFDMTTESFRFEVHGASDVYTATPIPPTLEQLGRYRLIIWECFGDGYNGQTGLLFASTLSRTLGPYLLAGGQLWVDGVLTVPAMGRSPNGMNADFVYPKDMTADPNSFAYHFMKLASARIMNAKGATAGDDLVGVKPLPERAETYPLMEQDPGKVHPARGSIRGCDAIFDPIDMTAAGLAGVLDSLYVYQAKSPTSSYQDKLNAVRWHDPDPAREHGRTQWFGFPLYYMKKDQAQETFNRAVDWFREEARP